jgi:hypothetical protein
VINSGPASTPLCLNSDWPNPAWARGGTGVLSVDGKELSRKTVEYLIPFLMSIDESFDIGSDTRTGVDDSYQLPFKFTGSIDKLTFKLEPERIERRGTQCRGARAGSGARLRADMQVGARIRRFEPALARKSMRPLQLHYHKRCLFKFRTLRKLLGEYRDSHVACLHALDDA